MKARPLAPDDLGPLCALVDADRLAGQAPCCPARLEAVLAGRSKASAWQWEQLSRLRNVGVEDGSGALVGAGAAARDGDGVPQVLWLHAGEDRRVVDAVVFNLLRGVRGSAGAGAGAFGLASDLAPVVEGLPRAARPATHASLLDRGFAGTDRWLYLRAAGAGAAPTLPHRTVGHAGELRIEVPDAAGATLAAAEIGLLGPETGVVWWLEVDPGHRRAGWGRQALRAARHALAGLGATGSVLVVDHDAPTERDRRPALALYQAEGYEIVDHLWSYRRP